MFRLYARSIMNGRGFQPMLEADKGGGGSSGSEGGDEGDKDKGGTGGQEGDEGGDEGKDKDDPITFDERQQKEIDRIINQRIAKERKNAAKAQQDALDREKMTADQKAENDRIVAEKKAADREAKANERMVNLEVKDVARELGVPAKKVDRFMKLVDREGIDIDDDGNVSKSDVEAAVKSILADFPEFKASEHTKGPGGGYDGSKNTAKYSKTQIEAMTTKEIADNWDDVQTSMKIHNKK